MRLGRFSGCGCPYQNYLKYDSSFYQCDFDIFCPKFTLIFFHLEDYGINTAVSTTLEPAAPPTPDVTTDKELVLSPKIKDVTLHPASPDDLDDNASGMHRSMSLMELSTRIWDTEATTYGKGTGTVSKFTTDTLPTPSELNVNDTTVTTSGDQDLLESPSLSPSSQQYTVSFHMHI